MNKLMVGKSACGKSIDTASNIVWMLDAGKIVFLLDSGGNYRHMCSLLQGEYHDSVPEVLRINKRLTVLDLEKSNSPLLLLNIKKEIERIGAERFVLIVDESFTFNDEDLQNLIDLSLSLGFSVWIIAQSFNDLGNLKFSPDIVEEFISKGVIQSKDGERHSSNSLLNRALMGYPLYEDMLI